MRFALVPAVALLAGCAAGPPSETPTAGTAAPAFAIPNPQRPGAKAAYCQSAPETADGCTFHTSKDQVNQAKLPADANSRWVASASEAGVVEIRQAADEGAYQVIEIVPRTASDADIIVTFDKQTGEPGSLKIVERRRVSVMIHAS